MHGCSGRTVGLAIALASAVAACWAPVASADYEYVAGGEALGPTDGVCPGIGIDAQSGYYRNEPGRNPRSNEPFYVEIKLAYFESFDCAAAFTGIRVTLPANLVLASGKSTACQRFDLATSAPDPRIAPNCPVTPAVVSGSTYTLDPIATNYPEKPFAG